MNHLFSNNNTFPENEYRMEACHANISYGLFNTNSNFINDLVNLTKVESEMFSEWRFALNIIIISLQILSGIFIFGGNLLVISAVATTKGLRRITDLYIVSLALADLLVAVLILPHFIMRQVYGYWPYESHELCIYWLSLNVFLCSASILNICCISVDRYIAINYPMKYISKRTRRTAFLMIGGAWVASFLVMTPPIFGSQHHNGVGSCYIRIDVGYRFLTAISIFFVPSLVVGFIWQDTIDKTVDASMNDRLKDQQREDEHRINSENKRIMNSKPKHSNTHNSMIYQRRKRIVYNNEKKTVKTVALVVCCFILCWLPFTTLYLMEGACECLFSEAIFMGTGWIAYLNSICNPFIYAFCNTKYAKAFKRLLHIGSNNWKI
ncbi:putative adrenoreceptor [Schistosoma mansoni]|uniref:putative adrenoreceptor n=1 Tax=Schistosoma mansoni TaxID=6183 RepID=UPI00022DC0F6|nr:putative adrenoreceptor [Schistosoma mansoni]|eukprot:XP_018651989.1 putative adrenoreceptor [Schistosoma mansoni]